MSIINRGSTIFLRAVVAGIGLLALIFCILVFPIMWRSENADYLPHFLTIQLSAVAFFSALYQVMKLLNYIDANKAFSELSITALKYIKYSAIAFGALYLLALPYIYYKGDLDDAPGPIAVAIILIASAAIAATFAAVLQKLVQSGVELKSEVDLTV